LEASITYRDGRKGVIKTAIPINQWRKKIGEEFLQSHSGLMIVASMPWWQQGFTGL